MNKALNEIYKQNLNYLARWNTGLANHVSMAAAAMFLMRDSTNISQQKLLEDAIAYSEQLSLKRKNDGGIKLDELTWPVQQKLLGHDDFQESWQSYFIQQFNLDTERTLMFWLSRLGDGLSAAAGHSVIRIHFALAVRRQLDKAVFEEEMAIAFSDLASRYNRLTQGDRNTGNKSLEEFLIDHSGLPNETKHLAKAGKLIEDRLMIIRTQENFQSTAQAIAVDYDLVQCLRLLSSMVTESANFALLHAITVGQALLDIMTWFPEMNNNPIRLGYRDYVTAIVIGEDLPNAANTENSNVKLSDIYSRVPQLNNDHAQKISFSLSRLYREFEYSEFLTAANLYQNAYG